MNKEDYVSMEVARLLKEKGYDEDCNILVAEEYWSFNKGKLTCVDKDREFCPFPTLYEAQKWLRETHNIHIVVSSHYSRKYEIIEYEYRIATYLDFLGKPFKWRESKDYYEIYEQCLNAGILEALKLI